MKYYSEITKKMYDTHEELDKAEEEYKKMIKVFEDSYFHLNESVKNLK